MYKNSSARRSRSSSFAGSRSQSNSRYRGGGGSRSNNNRSRKNSQTIDPKRFVKTATASAQTDYVPINSFDNFDIPKNIKNNLIRKGFDTPTQIQDQSIPVALQGKDIIGIANTGTGKTAAFLLPLLTTLVANRSQKALIVAPTRELALQIETECRDFANGTGIFTVLLIGGSPMWKQLKDLKRSPEVIIGTPGRIKDHVERGTLELGAVTTIVLDEVDRMLDMGFIKDITMLLSKLPQQRQSLFFSATLNPSVDRLIRTFTRDPVTVMSRTSENSDNVEQTVVRYGQSSEKIGKLHQMLLEEHVSKTLIFSETKRSVERLSRDLSELGFKTDAMHGDKSQGQRQRALKKFRDHEINILVATDVAARGIDVDGISHVINYDIPQTFDDYTHRIGRTGRGDEVGYSVTFVRH